MNTAATGVVQRIVTFLLVVREKPSTLSTREWDGIGIVSTLLIVCATTMPWTNFTGQAYWRKVVWLPFADACWQPWYLNDVVSNLILFMPLGWCMVFAQRSHIRNCLSRVVLFAITLSFTVEFFQVFSLQRSPSMTDVSTNTTGALLAALQAIYWQAQERLSPRRSNDLVVGDPLQPITIPVTTTDSMRNAECGVANIE